jgi:membrane-associated phospholipid phosphatase
MRTAEARLIDLDDRARSAFKPLQGSLAIRGLDFVSKLGDQPELRTIGTALIIVGTFASNGRAVRAGVKMIVAHEAATAAKNALKARIDRTRPRSVRGPQSIKPKSGSHSAKEESSFPSGHSAGAVAAASAFARDYPEFRLVALVFAAVVASSQIVRCAHYPSDVAAGVCLGIAAEAVTNGVWNALHMDQRNVA